MVPQECCICLVLLHKPMALWVVREPQMWHINVPPKVQAKGIAHLYLCRSPSLNDMIGASLMIVSLSLVTSLPIPFCFPLVWQGGNLLQPSVALSAVLCLTERVYMCSVLRDWRSKDKHETRSRWRERYLREISEREISDRERDIWERERGRAHQSKREPRRNTILQGQALKPSCGQVQMEEDRVNASCPPSQPSF